ncbi:hypothetical protein [Robertmurraya sp. FSL R5-0851]|uniref:hypothetical protein n=1 Tax=Robertmurraya sp. FSL R5-0851 TaxID=2921584 RepID=UPI0030F88B1D
MRALSKREVENIMSSLSEDQRNFLMEHTKQSKKSKWIETLANKKGIVLSDNMSLEAVEEMLDEWVLVDVLDGGYGSRPYECECGKSLRFQYIVYHKRDDTTYKLGETCFEHYTDLQPEVLKDIKTGFHLVDLERDEILLKFKQKDNPDLTKYLVVDTIPLNIKQQIQLHIPLTNNQLAKVKYLMTEYDLQLKREEAYNNLTQQQLLVFNTLISKEQKEILNKFVHSTGLLIEQEHAEKIGDLEIGEFAYANLPLLERHLPIIDEYITELDKKERDSKKLITYQTLIELHLKELKKLSNLESVMSIGQRREWEEIRLSVKSLKNGSTFDYELFCIKIENLRYALKTYLS